MKVAEYRPAPKRPSPGKAARRKVRVPRNALLVRFLLHPAGKTFLLVLACLLVVGLGVFVHYYNVYSKIIDERLRGGPYSTTARIFASPEAVAVGDKTTPSEIATPAAPRRLQ